jgi:hypothetical protein
MSVARHSLFGPLAAPRKVAQAPVARIHISYIPGIFLNAERSPRTRIGFTQASWGIVLATHRQEFDMQTKLAPRGERDDRHIAALEARPRERLRLKRVPAEQLRAIDRGLTAHNLEWPHAAAVRGTDEEGAGTALALGAVAEALRHENNPQEVQGKNSDPRLVTLTLAVFASIVLLLFATF